MVRRNVHHALVATPNLAVLAKKINVLVPMAQAPQGQTVQQMVNQSALRAAVAMFLSMLLVKRTSAHAQMVWAL